MFPISRVAAGLLVTTCLGSASLGAQQTWIVDPTGAGQFTDLQTAINAASPGDTLILRGGSYSTVIVDRSLHLVGDQPRPLVSSLQLRPGTNVSATALDTHYMRFSSCLASLEDVSAIDVQATGATASFSGCTFDGRGLGTSTTSLDSGARAVFDRCSLFGSSGFFIQTLTCTPIPGSPALVVQPGCTAEISSSSLTGGGPLTIACLSSPGTSGLSVPVGARVRISNSVVLSGGATVPAVIGGGALLHDNTTFVPAFAGGMPAFVPIVTGQGAAPGGAMQATLTAGSARPAAMVASLGLRAPVAVPEGTAWIDLGAFVVLRIALLDPTGVMQFSLPVPSGTPRGIPVTFQGVVQPGAFPTLVTTTPAVLHVL